MSKSYEELGFSDDFMFGKVMSDPVICKDFLNHILGLNIHHIDYVENRKEAINTAYNYLKANATHISGMINLPMKDYFINYQDLQGIGMTETLALPTLIALRSVSLGKPVLSSTAVLGEISISGAILKVPELANSLQVCEDSGAKKVLIPATSMIDFATVPADLMSAFQIIPY